MDEAIMQMVSITDTTPERAQQYLQVTDGDVNQAVSLFFESGGADLGGSTSTPAQPSTRATGSGNAADPINLDDDNISDDNDPSITGYRRPTAQTAGAEDDEAMARRLQDEMYGAGGDDENNIRAPIARQTETLVGPGADDYYGGGTLNEAIEQRMASFQSRRGRGGRAPGIFNQQPVATSHIWDENGPDRRSLAQSTGGASETNARSQHLARLFAPNWELMFNGTWEDARDEGKAEKKWLLVNIQNEKVFDCQVLNRDVWKNEGIIETVRENFVFLQYSKDDPRGDQYCQYYFQQSEIEDEYPHVAIVDPRTGEQVKLWSRKMPSAAEFLMQLHEFLDRYSLESKAKNPVAKRKSEAKKEKPVELLSEEEQMEKAIQASMGGGAAVSSDESLKVPVEDPDDLTRSVGDLKGKDVDMEEAPTNGSATKSPFASIPSDRPHEEPAQGPNVTRIQLRHPEGRIVRRFELADPVQRIYEYLKASPVDGKQGVEFELVAMGKNLMESREQTIEEAGLKNGTVMVEFIES
ncbi:UBX domain protein Ubx2 [Knufia obscura]|uniref:UBX domain protein Ubx2 n=2 Tax=Knufia TaxID=430999 RepID=A0AAN8F6N0_9EURO|nr:UBX domain protein Ubx2 [Knufia obscura]KAK5952331.1 UBX domain protein Ubx2 [Knufia fluminis]